VCLTASISPELHIRCFANFCAFNLRPWLGPTLAALRYVMYFRFLRDVTFARNGPYRGASIPSVAASDEGGRRD